MGVGAILNDGVWVARLAADDVAACGMRSEVTAIAGGAYAEAAIGRVRRRFGKASDIGGT